MVEAGLNIRSESRTKYSIYLEAIREHNLQGDETYNEVTIKLEIFTKLFLVLIVCFSLIAIVLIFELIIKFSLA